MFAHFPLVVRPSRDEWVVRMDAGDTVPFLVPRRADGQVGHRRHQEVLHDLLLLLGFLPVVAGAAQAEVQTFRDRVENSEKD